MSDYQPNLIEREIDELNARLHDLQKKGRFRRFLAYALKIIAGGSALVIALDIAHDYNRALGAAALIAVFVDTVFANYERLVGEVRAGYAARAQRDKIARDYNRALQPILKRLKAAKSGTPEHEAATTGKDELQNATQIKLQDAVAEVEKGLAELDLKALKALSLETERGSTEKKP